MCRWIAYKGTPIFMEQLVTLPQHSLVEQSLNTLMNKGEDGSIWATNGDGFGVGWYGEHSVPGLFKDESPAWSNENLGEICEQVKTHLFFAHVRATTTGAVQRNNAHPFKYKNWLFQHNGLISDFESLRRDLQLDIAPELYPELKGTTDSETFFLLALTYGVEKDPKAGFQKAIERVQKAAKDNGCDVLLNFSCALTDGDNIYTIRYSENDEPKTQFYSHDCSWLSEDIQQQADDPKNIVMVSEPLSFNEYGAYDSGSWTEVPENSFVSVTSEGVLCEELMPL